jgi:hypothetical protein
MAIEDYIPNVFGGVPTGYKGLLGDEQSTALSKRANLAGLLGFGSALAQGMSAQGYRRSALENILSAASAGFGGAGQAYESGLKNIINQQQLSLQQRQVAGINAMKQKYPDLADEFDTNPAGAFRLVAEREQAKTKPITVGEGQTVISPQGQVLFSAPGSKKKSTAVVGNTVVDLETGQPIYTAPEKPQGKILNSQEASALGLPPNIVYQQSATGEIKPVEGTGAKAPEIKDFADGTTRQYDAATQSWKVVARKPAGEGKTMYDNKPTVDAQGRLVFLPTRPGSPVLDAQTGKPVDGFMPKTEAKPLPPALQKAEEEDYDLGTSAANLARDANKYVTSIINGTIPFGLKERASIAVRSAMGSGDPDVVARNDFDRWRIEYVNATLRQNKGTQTEGDAVRATNELKSAESPEDAAKAIIRVRDVNTRSANDYQTSINRRRTNAKLPEAEVKLDIPKFEPYVFTDADYRAIPNGATYIDSKGVRRVKGKR